VDVVIDIDWNFFQFDTALNTAVDTWYLAYPVFSIGYTVTRYYVRSEDEVPDIYVNSASLTMSLSACDHVEEVGIKPWFVTEDLNSEFHTFVGYDSYFNTYEDTNSHSFVSFKRACSAFSSDMLPAACLAQGDALNVGFSSLSFNMLEFGLELNDLAKPFEFANGLYKFLRKPKQGGDVIFDVLDLLADWKLLYSFGIAPTINGAKEIAGKYSTFARAWRIATSWQTLYGTFSYSPTEDEFPPFPGAMLVGRSKLRLRVPPDSILPALLRFDQLGSLPTLSRVWDTLPFSFILDWFFNIGAKLDVVDMVSKLSMLEVAYVTNSVSMTYEFNDTDQETYGFYSVSSSPVQDPAGYKYFARYVLPTWQTFTPTRFGFLAGNGVPDYWLAGSLVYKLST
jgi:hypothetical protein